jgi:hypothetical protein
MSARDDEFPSRFPDRGITARPPSAPKRERLVMAELLLTIEKSLGAGRSDGEIYAKAGFRDENEYWSGRTAGIMSVSNFVHTLAIHRLHPSLVGVEGYKLDLSHALNFAFENGEPWCIETRDERRLRPREAAEYLMSQPKCEHLVPPGLKAFLASRNAALVPQRPNGAPDFKQPRSRPKFSKIVEDMRSMNRAELKSETEKSLAHRFGASRDTVRRARQEVLAEVDQSRSTKATIDS